MFHFTCQPATPKIRARPGPTLAAVISRDTPAGSRPPRSARRGISGPHRTMASISTIDLVIIVVYLAGIVGAGVWVGLRTRKGGAAGSYFLAGNTLGWPSIGLALFATNISCLHLVSLAQAGYDSGFLMGNFEWLAAFMLIALSLFFVPVLHAREGLDAAGLPRAPLLPRVSRLAGRPLDAHRHRLQHRVSRCRPAGSCCTVCSASTSGCAS